MGWLFAILLGFSAASGFAAKRFYDSTVLLKEKVSTVKANHLEEVEILETKHKKEVSTLTATLKKEKSNCKKKMARQKRRCEATKEHDSMLKSYKLSARECQHKLRAMALDLVKKEQETLR